MIPNEFHSASSCACTLVNLQNFSPTSTNYFLTLAKKTIIYVHALSLFLPLALTKCWLEANNNNNNNDNDDVDEKFEQMTV